jgi:hypothetical protein
MAPKNAHWRICALRHKVVEIDPWMESYKRNFFLILRNKKTISSSINPKVYSSLAVFISMQLLINFIG